MVSWLSCTKSFCKRRRIEPRTWCKANGKSMVSWLSCTKSENSAMKKAGLPNDMYPLSWTPRREGVFMRYSYEFKLECIELYRQGVWPETPEGVTAKRFKNQIREWDRIAIAQGEETLKHKPNNKIWTPEEKLELVSKVLAGNSRSAVALESGISPGQLYSWVRKYKEFGYNGLVDKKKGRKSYEQEIN